MPQCCVPQCNNRSENCDLSFYRFPTAEMDKNKWLKAIKRQNFIPTTNSRVCSWHFPVGKNAGPLRFAWNINNFLESPSPEKRRRKPNSSNKNHRHFDHSKRKKHQEEKTSPHVNPLVVLAQVALQDANSDAVLSSFDTNLSISSNNIQDDALDNPNPEHLDS
ncbi:domain-containing 5 isoform X1 [Octopus vulgaris]|uniref:Domain-containing 5 isoform X1 n=2 Tax=Octopus TaxID=6643 RepID=A0AA36AVN9_OCTVU|nr:THAP domain-containing protein 5 isoform X1 [Octopus sinensis]CAI9722579.1 domain-containing 5 isoform X1 [Octopus vulgaris]